MVDITDLDGVGPARSDSLEDAGYDSLEAIAEADADVLADEISVPDDTALGFVVQAHNLLDDEEEDENVSEDADDDSDEDEPLPGELAEVPESDDDDGEDDADEEVDPVYSLTVNLESDIHYDAYMTALLNAYERRSGSHQPALDAIGHALDDARYNSGEVSHELDEYELNTLHAAVSQQTNDYKGQNMIDYMDAMRDLLEQVNTVRQEELF